MPYFDADALKFLKELRTHNNKAWFDKNKSRYEDKVRDPFVAFLVDLAPKLHKLSPQFVVDARPSGGSVSRIYRDTRFSKDKSPYKLGLFAHFRHAQGKEGESPGLFFHFEPGRMSLGGGVWHPEKPTLTKIRAAIDVDGARWAKVTRNRSLGARCTVIGDSLQRPPPGFAADHPHIEDLKRKDFGLMITLEDKSVTSTKLLADVVAGYRAVIPFMAFLGDAVGVKV